MFQSRLKVGFIGCGSVANNHYQAVQQCESAELTAVSDLDESLGRAKAAEWGVDFRSSEQLIKSAEIDVIFVLTPMSSHYAYARAALEQGKHVLIEKPVSMDPYEIVELDRISERVGKVCMPGHSYIYLPELSRMKRMVSRGEIGQPHYLFMSETYLMADEKVKRYSGPSTECLCHHVYMMVALLGVPQQIQAFSSAFRKDLFPLNDEQIVINAAFGDGALAQLYLSWAAYDETSDPWTWKLKVTGASGGFHFSRRDAVSGTQREQRTQLLYDEMFAGEVDYLMNRCILRGEQPLSTMKDAAVVMRLIHEIRSSIANQRVETIEA